MEIQNQYGNVEIKVHNLPELKIQLEKKIRAKDEAKAKELSGLLNIEVEAKSPGYAVSTNRDQLQWRRHGTHKDEFNDWFQR